jgi:hypothetical protein
MGKGDAYVALCFALMVLNHPLKYRLYLDIKAFTNSFR